jgi:hypothetical protein
MATGCVAHVDEVFHGIGGVVNASIGKMRYLVIGSWYFVG